MGALSLQWESHVRHRARMTLLSPSTRELGVFFFFFVAKSLGMQEEEGKRNPRKLFEEINASEMRL